MTKKQNTLLYIILSLVLTICGVILEQLLAPNLVSRAVSDAYWIAVGASLGYFFMKGIGWIK